MKRICLSLLLALSLIVSSGIALASDISDALYYATIAIFNTGTATSPIAANFTLNTQVLINADFLNSSANNCAIRSTTGADTYFMPSVGSSYPWITWVSSMSANNSIRQLLYTNASGGAIRYFPSEGGMTTADSASLEFGDNFTIEQKGYLDITQVGDDLSYKEDAFRSYISSSGNVSSVIMSANFTTPDSVSADGWGNADNAIDDDTGTYASETVGTEDWSAYVILYLDTAEFTHDVRYWYSVTQGSVSLVDFDLYYNGSWNNIDEVSTGSTGQWLTISMDSVELATAFRIRFYNPSSDTQCFLQLHEVDYGKAAGVMAGGLTAHDCTVTTGTDGTGWTNYSNAYDEDTGTYAESSSINSVRTPWLSLGICPSINATKVRWWQNSASGSKTEIQIHYNDSWTQIYSNDAADNQWVEQAFSKQLVSATRIRRWYEGSVLLQDQYIYEFDFWNDDTSNWDSPTDISPFLYISIDDTEYDTEFLNGASVPDNSSNWTFVSGYSMSYLEYQEITVGGVQQQYIEWEYDDSTFPDQSGNSHDATPTFRITGSDADITANITVFQPVNEAQSPGYTITDPDPFIEYTDNTTANFTTTIDPPQTWAQIIEDVTAPSNTPTQLPYTLMSGFAILAMSWLVAYLMKRGGTNSLIAQMIVICAMMGLFIAMQLMDFWILIFFVIFAVTMAMASKQVAW